MGSRGVGKLMQGEPLGISRKRATHGRILIFRIQ